METQCFAIRGGGGLLRRLQNIPEGKGENRRRASVQRPRQNRIRALFVRFLYQETWKQGPHSDRKRYE